MPVRPVASGPSWLLIGPCDALIAGQALARGLTLLSRNAAEFRRVAGLKREQF